jgi:hypothetical protein
MLEIVPYNLHWLAEAPARGDLCAHGVVRVADGTHVLASIHDTDLALSTGALHLLRALSFDHTAESRLADHLIPHCGHFMAIDGPSRRLVNVGCNLGLNWWIRHRNATVELEFDEGRRHDVGFGEWHHAVCAFSDAIAGFIQASPPREPAGDHDREWYAAFQKEWRRRRDGH